MCECVDFANMWFECVIWLIDDWTKDRGKRKTLYSDFIERILHKRCIGAEITVVVSCLCSLCSVSKVYVVESFRLSCLLVNVDSTFRRWWWSLCLVQILSVALWLGCRCCWKRSMMWTHSLERLDDRCPGLTGVVSMLVRAVSRSWTRCYKYYSLVVKERLLG